MFSFFFVFHRLFSSFFSLLIVVVQASKFPQWAHERSEIIEKLIFCFCSHFCYCCGFYQLNSYQLPSTLSFSHQLEKSPSLESELFIFDNIVVDIIFTLIHIHMKFKISIKLHKNMCEYECNIVVYKISITSSLPFNNNDGNNRLMKVLIVMNGKSISNILFITKTTSSLSHSNHQRFLCYRSSSSFTFTIHNLFP